MKEIKTKIATFEKDLAQSQNTLRDVSVRIEQLKGAIFALNEVLKEAEGSKSPAVELADTAESK